MTNSTITIYNNPIDPCYISYSKENEQYHGIERYVNELVAELRINQILTKIDKDNKDDDLISDFEKEIGQGKIVCVFLSKKYLESEHCMFEWVQIHKNSTNKCIIYVKVEDENNKWNYNGWKKGLKEYWKEKSADYWNDYIEGAGSPTQISQSTYNCCFFYKEIQNIEGKKDQLNQWFSTSDPNFKPKIVNKIQQYIQDKKLNKSIEIRNILLNKQILLIGDSILEYVNGDRHIPLGKYIEESLKQHIGEYKTLREWNRAGAENIDKIKREYCKVFTTNASNISNKVLLKLLNCKNFDIIFSIGYSSLITSTILDFFKTKDIEVEIIKLDTKLEELASVIVNREKNAGNTNTVTVSSNGGHGIRLYQLTQPIENDQEYNQIVLTEQEIVRHTNQCISAFGKDENKYFRNRNLLALGTFFPGWAVRFIWASLTKDNNQYIMSNKQVDDKTRHFMDNRNDTCLIKIDNTMYNLINSLDNEKKQPFYQRKQMVAGLKHIYVFYLEEEYEKLNKFFVDVLEEIEKKQPIRFVWRSDFTDSKVSSDLIHFSNKFILFRVKDNYTKKCDNPNDLIINKLYNEELNDIRKKNKKIGSKVFVISDNGKLTNPIMCDWLTEPNFIFDCHGEEKYNDLKIQLNSFVTNKK